MDRHGEILPQLESIGASAFVPGRGEWTRAKEEWQLHHQPIEVWVQNRTLQAGEAEALAQLLKRIPSLSVLKLNCTGLSEAQVQEIVASLPAVRLEVTNAI